MATWSGKKHYCKSWHTQYRDGESDWMTWEYQTTADTFRLVHNMVGGFDAYMGDSIKPAEHVTYMGPEEALAAYRALRSWILKYYGVETLAQQDELEAHED